MNSSNKYRPGSLAGMLRAHPGVKFPEQETCTKLRRPPAGHSTYRELAALSGLPWAHVKGLLKGSCLPRVLVKQTAYFKTSAALDFISARCSVENLPESPPVGFCKIGQALELSRCSRSAFSRKIAAGQVRAIPGVGRNRLGYRTLCKFYSISDCLRFAQR